MKALWQSTEPRHDTFMVECYIILRDSPGRACAVGAVVGIFGCNLYVNLLVF